MVRRDYGQMHGSSLGSKPQWCSHCRVVVLGNGVRKCTKELPMNKLVYNTNVFKTPKLPFPVSHGYLVESLDNISPLKGYKSVC